MKIGEFAKLCGTRISVLRYYNKEKLLMPVKTKNDYSKGDPPQGC